MSTSLLEEIRSVEIFYCAVRLISCRNKFFNVCTCVMENTFADSLPRQPVIYGINFKLTRDIVIYGLFLAACSSCWQASFYPLSRLRLFDCCEFRSFLKAYVFAFTTLNFSNENNVSHSKWAFYQTLNRLMAQLLCRAKADHSAWFSMRG